MSVERLISADAQIDRPRRCIRLRVHLVDGETLRLVDAPMTLDVAEGLVRDMGEAIGRLRAELLAIATRGKK